MNPDLELRHDVLAQLNWDPALYGASIDVKVESGVVVLSGAVADQRLKDEADRAVRRVTGMKALLNHIVVRPAASQPQAR